MASLEPGILCYVLPGLVALALCRIWDDWVQHLGGIKVVDAGRPVAELEMLRRVNYARGHEWEKSEVEIP